MAHFRTFFEKFPFLFSKKKGSIIIGCILGFCLVYLVRSCTLGHSSEPTFHIGQDKWENMDLMGKERNLAAFNNQLMSAVAKQENFRISIVVAPQSELIRELEEGKLQGVLTSLQSSYLNEQRLIFSEPYFLTGPVLIIPSTAPLEGWNEKGKKIIGIPRHSPVLTTLEQDPTIQTKIYDDILTALSDLRERRIDGAIFPAIPSYTYVNTFYKNELKIATLPLTDEGIRLAAQKNDAGRELIGRFSKGIAEIKKNGVLHQLFEQWGLINAENFDQSNHKLPASFK